jgi:membrane protein implicated in regulation of membrane protease activity
MGDDVTTVTPRDEEGEEGLGTRFWLKLFAGILAIGIVLLIVLLVFWRALYAWGLFGAFAAIAVVSLVFGWIYDRRKRTRERGMRA